MDILMMSKSGDGLGIAQRMVEEGHSVKVWIEEKGFDKAGLGIIERVQVWRPHFQHMDLIVFDMNGLSKFESTFETTDVPVFGLSKFADMMELDRGKQSELLELAGLNQPNSRTYKSPGEAASIIDKFPKNGVVIKPSGNLDTGKTYIVKDVNTYEWALEQFTGDQELIVQDFVKGVEISTEGWFDGDRFVSFNHTFEEKRFLNDDLGQNTGCMGNVVFKAPARRNRLVDEVKKLSPFLERMNYRGPIDINFIANETGIFVLELTPRLGYDAIEALTEILDMDITDLFVLAASSALYSVSLKDGFAIAVRVSTPPFPMSDNNEHEDLPIDVSRLKRVPFMTDAYREKGSYFTAGSDGVIMKVTSHAKTVAGAISLVYKEVGKIGLLDAQYRTDIGARVVNDLKALKNWKYL